MERREKTFVLILILLAIILAYVFEHYKNVGSTFDSKNYFFMADLQNMYGAVVATFLPVNFYAMNSTDYRMYDVNGNYLGTFDVNNIYNQLTLKMPTVNS